VGGKWPQGGDVVGGKPTPTAKEHE